MAEQIIEFDSNLLNELDEQKQNIEVKKAEQEKKKTDLRVAKAKQGQMQILMENQKTLQVSYASKLSEEEKNLYEQIEQYKKEQEDLENQIQAAINWSGALAIQYKGGVMLWPIAVDGTYITSPYGNRLHPIQGVYRYHDGIDIGNAGYGAPVIAAADGIVTYAGVMSGYGNCVMINHGDGIVTLYGHGQEIYTELGATVKQGDVIMAVGSTGNSTGPHLHFEVRKSPYNYKYFVLNDIRDNLYERINKRVDIMFDDGLIDEMQLLTKMGIGRDNTSMQGIGYKEILDYWDNLGKPYGSTIDENGIALLKEQIKGDTRHFAKRQLTWFRREKVIDWININEYDYDCVKIMDYMLDKLKDSGIIK